MLHYKKSGNGPVVVLIHGFLLSSEYWHTTQKNLERDHTVISIDLLGFGHSPKPKDAQYTIEEQLDQLHETLRSLQLTSFILVGHSMGGLIAAHYAVVHPSRVRQLLLYMPPIFLSPTQAFLSISRTNMLYKIGLYSKYGRLLWIPAKLLLAIGSSGIYPRYTYIARSLRHSTHQSRTLSQRHIIEGTPLIPIIRQLTVPTELFIGTQDRIIYQKNIAKHSRELNNISIQNIAGGHHYVVKNPHHIRQQIT